MIDISVWTKDYLRSLKEAFGDRVWFVGLQGSHGRGEATETSDIDMVVILDQLTPGDITAYNAMLDTLPHRELACGFLSGKDALMHWEPSDLFQFYFDTTPILGSMDELLPLIDDAAVNRAIKVGVCNIFHGCVHNMLYEKDAEMLKGLYKGASFVVQAICYRQTGRYIRHQIDLLDVVSPEEAAIVRTFLALKKGQAVDFQEMSENLFAWSQGWISKT